MPDRRPVTNEPSEPLVPDEPGQTPATPPSQDTKARPRATLAGRVWVAIGASVVLLVLLIIFIAENSRKATISFLGAHGALPLGLLMLIAAVAGALITLLVGTSRILQLRREVRRHAQTTTGP
jgi:uncharacterized integral membrane protein